MLEELEQRLHLQLLFLDVPVVPLEAHFLSCQWCSLILVPTVPFWCACPQTEWASNNAYTSEGLLAMNSACVDERRALTL